jgi:endonuclease/exonuclease/phosphatase family metal-dependent hydrolase
MTWNIHGGRLIGGRCDLRRVVRYVRRHKPDIVALQEVDSRRKGNVSEPAFEFLTGALGNHMADARLITAPDGDYGHALISRWPMTGIARHDVSLEGREPRAAIETNIETPFGPLHVVSVHLGLSLQERRHQAALLAKLSRSGPERSILLGDFNDWLWRGSVQETLARCTSKRTHHHTFPAFMPLLPLDRIYCRPASLLVRSWTDRSAWRASDHLPVIADLRMH